MTSSSFLQHDITVPAGSHRMVVVMTWDEPAASAGAAHAVVNDVDLWIDWNGDCTGSNGQCGEFNSSSRIDNTEYVIIDNPQAGPYRLKATPWNVVDSSVRAGIAVVVIRGDPTPTINLSTQPSSVTVVVGNTFNVTVEVSNPSYIASGVYLKRTSMSEGLVQHTMITTREDGVSSNFLWLSKMMLGNIHEGDSRNVTWTFLAEVEAPQSIEFSVWSENGGTQSLTVPVTVLPSCGLGAESSVILIIPSGIVLLGWVLLCRRRARVVSV